MMLKILTGRKSITKSPFYFYVPFDYEKVGLSIEKGWKISDIFPINSVGIVTSRDKFVMDFDQDVLKERFIEFRDLSIPNEEIQQKFDLKDKTNWRLSEARAKIANEEDWDAYINPCLYRPFDIRQLYNHPAMLERDRREVMRHMLHGSIRTNERGGGWTHHRPPSGRGILQSRICQRQHHRESRHTQQQRHRILLPALSLPARANLAMVTCRQQSQIGNWNMMGVTNILMESCYISNKTKEINYLFPLYLYPQDSIWR